MAKQIVYYKLFVEALLSCLELDHLVQFSWCEDGFIIQSIDSYQTTCLKHVIKANGKQPPNTSSVQIKQVHVNVLKKHIDDHVFIELSNDNVRLYSQSTGTKTELCFFEHLAFAPIKDYAIFENSKEKVTIQHSQQELVRMLINLNTFSSRCYIALNAMGEMLLRSCFELGEICVRRQLEGFSTDPLQKNRMLYNFYVIIKFAKMIGCCGNLSSNTICNVEFQENGIWRVCYRINNQTDSFLCFRPVGQKV